MGSPYTSIYELDSTELNTTFLTTGIDGSVSINAVDGAQLLRIDADNLGSVSVGAIGGTTPVASVEITGDTITSTGGAASTGFQNYNSQSLATFSGNYTTGGNLFNVNSAIEIAGATDISTDGGNASIFCTINDDAAAGDNTLLIDVTVGGSQKGLMLPPGLSFNAISEKAVAASETAGLPRAYWDWQGMLGANAQNMFPYTPATNLLYGLKEAVDMLQEEGLENVFARHARHGAATRAAVQAWGLEVLCRDEAAYSGSLTAVLISRSDGS